jgi:hypothetical protein
VYAQSEVGDLFAGRERGKGLKMNDKSLVIPQSHELAEIAGDE